MSAERDSPTASDDPFAPPRTALEPERESTRLATRATVTRELLLACGVMAAIGCAADVFGLASGAAYSPELGEFTGPDFALAGVVCLQFLVYVATVVAFCMWIHRAHVRLLEAGIASRYTPGWAVGWWFVPLANLWKPFDVTRELWRRSRGGSQWFTTAAPGWIGLWWALCLVSDWAPLVSLPLELSRGAAATGHAFNLVSNATAVPAAWLAVRIVTQVTAAQRELLGSE